MARATSKTSFRLLLASGSGVIYESTIATMYRCTVSPVLLMPTCYIKDEVNYHSAHSLITEHGRTFSAL